MTERVIPHSFAERLRWVKRSYGVLYEGYSRGQARTLTRHALSAMTVNCRKATDSVQIGSRTYDQYAVKMRESDLWPLTSGICIGKQGGTTVILARP